MLSTPIDSEKNKFGVFAEKEACWLYNSKTGMYEYNKQISNIHKVDLMSTKYTLYAHCQSS